MTSNSSPRSMFSQPNATLLRQWDNDHVWHPFAPMQAFREENVPIIERGEGFYLIDVEGNRFIDGISSLWCNMHGHQVPEIDRAIEEQLKKIGHTTMLGLSSPPAIQLAKALVDRAPGPLSKVFYSDSGSTAVEVAIKLAFQYHQQKASGPEKRTLFLCMSNAYHGDTVGSVSVGGISLFHGIYGNLLFETLQVPTPVATRTPDGYTKEGYLEYCFQEMERLIRENHEKIAGFIIEPLVQGAAGILVHPAGYLKRVRELTREFSIPLICDEVAVGFGRTGTCFACEQENVEPDFLCLAKGISAGYLPLAATLTTEEVFNAFLGEPHEGRTFYHGHTYTGNPLACAAALASLELFEEQNLLVHIGKQSALISEKFAPLAEHPHVGEIRQKGIMVGIELVGSREGMLPFPATARMGHQVTLEARSRGLIIRPLGDVIVLMPAPGMPLDLLAEVCEITKASIQAALEFHS